MNIRTEMYMTPKGPVKVLLERMLQDWLVDD